MSMRKKREAYLSGVLDKPKYIQDMYEDYHSVLFEFSDAISETEIEKIEILEGEVRVTSVKGVVISIPAGDHRVAPIEAINFLEYEPGDSSVIESFIRDAKVFVDIGANIGWYSIGCSLVNPSAEIFCFEPVPDTFKQLKKNIELNGADNVNAFDFGLSNEDEIVDFFVYPEGGGNASARDLSRREGVSTVSVQLRTLDSCGLFDRKKIDFIKLDIEGGELLALMGAQRILARDKPVIFCEILRKWSKEFGYNPNDILCLLRDIGYESYEIVDNGVCREITVIDDDTVATNFLFRPQR